MKIVNKLCQIFSIVFSLAALVLFFTPFVSFNTGDGAVSAVGAQLAFGSSVKVAGEAVGIAHSVKLLFCFWVTVIGVLLSVFSFKSKKVRYAAPVFGIIAGIFMLVVALSSPYKFVDFRPFTATGAEYSIFVLLTAIALLAFAVVAIAYLLVDDYLEVLASKGAKKTILKRVVLFFRDYKSEVKKIVWPGIKDVLKNTGIVLIMCLLIGIFIWVLDFGLGKLLELVLGL